MKKIAWAGSLVFTMLAAQAQQTSAPEVAEQAIPDAPSAQSAIPQARSVAPGIGSSSAGSEDDNTQAAAAGTPAPQPARPQQADDASDVQTGDYKAYTLSVQVNFVPVPFTVKDSKNRLVSGIQSRDVRVYENGLVQHIAGFWADRFPLSVAVVIDQTLEQTTMDQVNTSMGSLQSAFAPYDEVAVFTYNNGPKLVTDYTASQSARLTQAIEAAKAPGRQPYLAGSLSGPMACTTCVNGQQFDPNTATNRGQTANMQVNMPREVHTLNDAIFEAAKSLSRKDPKRRRVIYVISDGKEYGSVAKTKDVIKYLQTNNIAVYGTLVGDSSLPLVGFLDKIHMPLQMRDNVLATYANQTGGNFDAEFRTGGMQRSFAKIVEEVGTQYVLGYYTHEPLIDGKYRTLEVRVLRPELTVIAKKGYWPAAVAMSRPLSTQ